MWRVLICFVLFVFLGPSPRHTEVPRLGVESELQPPAYTTATATRDPSRVCGLHHSSWQHRILNPLSRGQGSHGRESGSFPLSRDEHSKQEERREPVWRLRKCMSQCPWVRVISFLQDQRRRACNCSSEEIGALFTLLVSFLLKGTTICCPGKFSQKLFCSAIAVPGNTVY